MRKIYRKKKFKGPPTKYWRNDRIRAPEVKLIDEEGEMLGVMKTGEALKLAQERGLDLIEIAPKAQPPVAKIADWGSFKYNLEKKLQKQKSKLKKIEIKGIRLSLRISDHDREVRINQANKFMGKGHKLKIEMVLRGREHRHTDLGRKLIIEFIDELKQNPEYNIIVEQPLSKAGGKLTTVLFNKN